MDCANGDDDVGDGVSGDVENKYRKDKDGVIESGDRKDEDNGRVEVDAVVENLRSGDVDVDGEGEREDENKCDGNAREKDAVGRDDDDGG